MTLILTRNGVVFRPTKGSVEKAIADREVLRAFVPTDSRADAVLSGGDGGDNQDHRRSGSQEGPDCADDWPQDRGGECAQPGQQCAADGGRQ